ncbi:poly(U)-specific endoribonuclease-C-like [Clarias magur]|uniref:Uridylate-specific endoribonuclease n=1 Tax=Clarias magur TaxID=1594786 RepID=A0A8J4ULJ1_CLAMG|nr:poly(U)-specific endoribonuclease-C-like [Clarias magur]
MSIRQLQGCLVLLAFFGHFNEAAKTVNEELSNIIGELWKLDNNRLNPGTDYKISLQGRAGFIPKGSNVAVDHASSPLFSHVNEDKLKSITTYARFMKLLDNYERSTGVAEKVTTDEIAENNAFLDAILETAVMKKAHQYLVKKGKSNSELRLFKTQLYNMWFRLYHRERNGG